MVLRRRLLVGGFAANPAGTSNSAPTQINHGRAQDEVAAWEGKLVLLQEGLTALASIQRKWLYLEPIFARGALPSARPRFAAVDGELRAVLAHLHVSGFFLETARGRCQATLCSAGAFPRPPFEILESSDGGSLPVHLCRFCVVAGCWATHPNLQPPPPALGSLDLKPPCCHLPKPPRNDRPPPPAQASRKVVAFTDLPCPRERLAGMAAALDACQRALNEFLEDKRGAFPRRGGGPGGVHGAWLAGCLGLWCGSGSASISQTRAILG
jgi:hypothetical protein